MYVNGSVEHDGNSIFFFLSNFSKNDNSQWAQVLEILQTNEIFSGKLPY